MCHLCKKPIEGLNYFLTTFDLSNYPDKPPEQLYTNIKCKQVYFNNLSKCELDGQDINYA